MPSRQIPELTAESSGYVCLAVSSGPPAFPGGCYEVKKCQREGIAASKKKQVSNSESFFTKEAVKRIKSLPTSCRHNLSQHLPMSSHDLNSIYYPFIYYFFIVRLLQLEAYAYKHTVAGLFLQVSSLCTPPCFCSHSPLLSPAAVSIKSLSSK